MYTVGPYWIAKDEKTIGEVRQVFDSYFWFLKDGRFGKCESEKEGMEKMTALLADVSVCGDQVFVSRTKVADIDTENLSLTLKFGSDKQLFDKIKELFVNSQFTEAK